MPTLTHAPAPALPDAPVPPALDPDVRRRRLPRALVAGAVSLVLGIEAVLAAPHVEAAATALARAEAAWVGVAVLAAAASMTAFALVRRRLLGAAGVRVGLGSSLASILVGNALHVTLPGGIAFSTAYSYRWMREHGAGTSVAGWSLAVNGLLSTATLAGLGLATSLLSSGTSAVRLAVEIVAVAAAVAGARTLARRPHRALAVAGVLLAATNRLLRRPGDAGFGRLIETVTQLRSVRPNRNDWTAATTFALLNWLFDVGCLAACARATGVPGLTPTVVLVAAMAGMATSSVAVLPAGLGTVEAVLVVALVAGGIPAAPALSAVVLYRLVSLVGVVAVGWVVHGGALLRSRSSSALGCRLASRRPGHVLP
jgi:putative heme transporter